VLGDAHALEQDEHARVWRRANHDVDLHRTFLGIGAPPAVAWEVLTRDTAPFAVGGTTVQVLGVPARTLVVALHAAASGPHFPKPLADLSRAVASVDFEIWQRAADLAARVDAAAALAAGLRLDEQGRELARRLDLPTAVPLDVALRASAAPPLAVDLVRAAQTPGIGPKLRLVGRKLVPTPALMRVWSPLARRGRAGLAVAYVARPLTLIRHAPAALAAIRAARAPRTLE
jgi:hypothetical protein